ncbi:MAG: hypothetical protein KDA24_25490 [Deltaproteobacteria bacterium]|nr:hypothetical protein [Deltaproteobacteria bacterium]
MFPRPLVPADLLATVLAASVLVVVPAPAAAQDEPAASPAALSASEEAVSALQLAAVEAMMAGDWATAEDTARRALELNGGPRAAQARLVLVLALEERGAIDEALSQLDTLLELELLPRHREKAEEMWTRLLARSQREQAEKAEKAEKAVETEEVQAGTNLDELELGLVEEEKVTPASARTSTAAGHRRAPAIGLVAAGAAPLVVGGMFIGWDIDFAERGIESGTWALIGAPLLLTGIAAEVIGLALLAPKKRKVAQRPLVVPLVIAGPAVGNPNALEAGAGVIVQW